MIQPGQFLRELAVHGISFYSGVPDSMLKGLIACVEKTIPQQHFIAANEGAALGLAAGYHLATGEVPVVYLQNSGLGNLVNPLTSLTDREMYSIPALLIIGWRGEPGIKDEPQHKMMGKITPALLKLLNVPFIVLKKESEREWKAAVNEAIGLCKAENRPAALLVEADVFTDDEIEAQNFYSLSSEDAIQSVYKQLSKDDIVICTTGKIGRVFYKINSGEQKISRYFLNVGSMGHAVSIAAGLAIKRSERVFLFDGDGALLMHTGALALTASLKLKNLHYILLNNGAHQSVGSQPTLGFAVDFCAIAKGFGFQNPVSVEGSEQLNNLPLSNHDFIEIRINTQTDVQLPRPAETPREAKEMFMNSLGVPSTKY